MSNVSAYSRLLICCLLLAVTSGAATAGPALDRIKERGKIVIAYRDSSVPFSYVESDGRPMGYAIDLCERFTEAVKKRLGMKSLTIEYVKVTSATRIQAMIDGKADLECESTTNNAERRQKVAFTVPHYITGARYVVRAGSGIEQLRDFRGKKLVSTVGTTPLKAARQADKEHALGIQIGEVPDHVKGIEQVETGVADGFVMDEVLLAGLIATRTDPSRLKVVGKYLTTEALAIMLPINDIELKKLVDDEMKRLIRSGEAGALHDRWFTQPIPPSSRTLGLPMPFLLRDSWKYPSDWVPN
jgi:ABC-type amino acid transport substrate-binding protein